MSRCYLCNCTFLDGKVYENMFDKRYNTCGIEENTLAQILALVLGYQLKRERLHSTFMCSICKVSLLNFEAMEHQLSVARLEIQTLHGETLKLYLNQESPVDSGMVEECSNEVKPFITDQDLDELIDHDLDAIDDEIDIKETCSDSEDMLQPGAASSCPPRRRDFSLTSTVEGQQIAARRSQRKLCCSYCGKTFARRQWLEEHEHTHTGERPYKCDKCDASFAQRTNLRSHIRVTHQNKTKFGCSYCERSFKRKRLLDNHVKSKHTLVRDLKCENCDATFSNAAILMKHLLCHTGEKNYSCQICGKQFSRAENRNVHHFVHSIRKPYACVVCDEGFMRKQQLQEHIAVSKHPNPKIVRRKPQFSAANSDKLLQRPLNETNK